ncbi:MAG: hypothetical protein J4F49_04595 [Rhodobacteraceae bacterium]|nr:hypothetical protein [Paracoccaceae bacterium]
MADSGFIGEAGRDLCEFNFGPPAGRFFQAILEMLRKIVLETAHEVGNRSGFTVEAELSCLAPKPPAGQAGR